MIIRKVLLIDDNEIIRVIVRIGLEQRFNVLVAASGEEGILIALAAKPDVILLDVRMPGGLTGPETVLRLKENPLTVLIPIVLMTASVQVEELASYRKLDVVGIIPKPFSPLSLADELCDLVAHLD